MRVRDTLRGPSSWRLLSGFLVICAFAACAGCAPVEDVVDDTGSTDSTESVVAAEQDDIASAGWLQGTWTTTYVLDELTAAVFEEDADIGVTPVVIAIDETGMTVTVDGVTYRGVVVFGDADFRFEGSTKYEEDDGTAWSSDAIISGHRDGDDAWSGDTWARFVSDGEALYEATWMQSAERTP